VVEAVRRILTEQAALVVLAEAVLVELAVGQQVALVL
jgi:hypothetical protein